MRRFKFRLETVLRQRTAREEKCLREFAAAQNEKAACEARLAAYRAERERTILERPEPPDPEDEIRREFYLDGLNARMEHEEKVREGIAARLESARIALMAARHAREALERVKENDFNEYKMLNAREEQHALDEVATMRYSSMQDQ
jgi:flagellar FliJ protein